jgi:kinesin family protein C1
LSNAEKERRLEDMKSCLARMEAKLAEKKKMLAEKEKMLGEAELLRKKLHNQKMDLKGHMRVFATFGHLFGNAKIMVNYPKSLEHVGRGIQLMRKDKNVLYTYDKVFDHTASHETIFKYISELMQSAIDGYKVTIFFVCPIDFGNTYTMIGKPSAH